jgi:hypothetical protein
MASDHYITIDQMAAIGNQIDAAMIFTGSGEDVASGVALEVE